MPIRVQCECGRSLHLNDNLAGKTIRCPNCSGPVAVPRGAAPGQQPGTRETSGGRSTQRRPAAKSQREPASQRRARERAESRPGQRQTTPARNSFDDYEYDDGGYAATDLYSQGPAFSPPAAGVAAPRKKSGGFPLLPILIGGGLFGVIAIAGVLALILSNAGGGNGNGNGGGGLFGAGGNANANPNGQFWVVVSDFSSRRSSDFRSMGEYEISVDYEVVSGSPDQGRTYYMYIISEGFMGDGVYFEERLNLNSGSKGNVSFLADLGIGGGSTLTAFVGYEVAEGTFFKISGDLHPGGAATTSTPAKSASELAGAAAAGKLVALANVRNTTSGLHGTISVDYEVQGQLTPGARYAFILEGHISNYEFDVTSDFQRSDKGTVVLEQDPSMFSANVIYVQETRGSQVQEVSNRVNR